MVERTRRRGNPTADLQMDDTILITIPTSPRLLSVATLVLGGIGSRLHLPYEQVDDLQLAALSTLAASEGDTVAVEIRARDDDLSVGLGPLAKGSGGDAGLRRVLDRLVDSVETSSRDGHEWITLRVRRTPSAEAG
jgi:hypothetical protein